MNDDWLEIADEAIEAQEIVRQIRERLSQHKTSAPAGIIENPNEIAAVVRGEIIGAPGTGSTLDRVLGWRRDCDLVPQGYSIEWQVPILGPIHAAIRRIIHAEVRRYMLPVMEKQSRLNRAMLQILEDLIHENARLREEVLRLRDGQD